MAEWNQKAQHRISDVVSDLVTEHNLPGITVGVVSGKHLVYAQGFGLADIESGRPQDPGLKQRIGSITKTMVGLCVMALVDEGKLSVDDRITDRLPDVTFHGPAEELEVRHLLTHTGGMGEAPMPADFPDAMESLWADELETRGIPGAYPDGITIDVPPGTKWAYANHGFALLGEITARIEGRPIEEVLHRRVFSPLGMADTDCHDLWNADPTTGYHHQPTHDERDVLDLLGQDQPDEETVDGYNIRGRYQYVAPRAAGAVQSTLLDMAGYATALLQLGGGIVRPDTFDIMVAPHWCPDDRMASQGLPFRRAPRFGRSTFSHGGGITGGWNSHLIVIPEEDLAVLVHLNLYTGSFGQVESRILQAVLDEPDQSTPNFSCDPGILATAPGVFEPLHGHLTNFRIVRETGRVQIKQQDGGLLIRSRHGAWKNGVRMLPADPYDPAFFLLDTGEPEPAPATLELNESGVVTGIRFDRMVYLVRNDSLVPWD